MARVACPFCFHQIDSSRLAFQCTGNGNVRCVKERDKDREERAHSTLATFPTFLAEGHLPRNSAPCPTCGGAARRRACPACHTPLPIEFVGSDSQMIGLVGAKASGKTVLMTTLVKRLREVTGRRFGADIRMVTDNPDGQEGMTAYYQSRESALFDNLVLPSPTEQAASVPRVPIVLRWRQEVGRPWGSTLKSAIFSFLDTAGEDLNDIETAFTLRYLAVADALIVVLDPFMLPGAVARAEIPRRAVKAGGHVPLDVLGRLTEVLRVERGVKRKRKIRIPVAVVFTKIDAFYSNLQHSNVIMSEPAQDPAYDDEDGQTVHEQVLALLHEWKADDIDRHLRLHYQEYRFFAVSALGEQPDYDKDVVSGRGVRPHRVEDPVLWLLARSRGVPRR